MTRMKSKMKKGMAGLFAAVMAAGLLTSIPGSTETVWAGSTSGTEPSITAYATKNQLENWDYKNTVGKIALGKDPEGYTIEWYILGSDSGVNGGNDNTAIFATDYIFRNIPFEASTDQKNFISFGSSNGTYREGVTISTTNANHYGSSNLRKSLYNAVNGTTYFTAGEKSLLQATTVTTKDTFNNETYTTTDILYAISGEYGDSVMYAGSDNSKELSTSVFWFTGNAYWLRSPADSDGTKGLGVYESNRKVTYYQVTDKLGMQPASNLNLTSVLFASSATSEYTSGVIDTSLGEAMTLRLDGTNKNIGTATYNPETRSIQVEKGSTSQKVSLIVQGDDGTNGWYCCKEIDNTSATISTEDVRSSLGLTSVDLSACKIWLEITDTDGLLYAVNATDASAADISSVAITGIDTPVANTALDTEASCTSAGVGTATPQITWDPADSTAAYNTSYTASITLTADTGYKFTDSTTVTVNGDAATSVTRNADGTLTVTYAFPATAKDKSASTTDPKSDSKADKTDGNAGASTNQTGNKTTDGASKTGTATSNVSPKTGDDTSVAWISILVLLAGTGLVIIARKRMTNPN